VGISERVVLKTTELGRCNRTIIPEEMQKLLNLLEGNEIAWVLEENRVVIKIREAE